MTPSNSPVLDDYFRASQGGDHHAALQAVLDQIDQHPRVSALHWLAASAYAHLGQMDAAEAAFSRALLLDPAQHVARFQLGLLQFSSGRPNMAMQTWAPLEQLPENHYLVYFKRGFAALAIDAFDDAILLFSRGIEANQEVPPLNGDIQMMIGEIERSRADKPKGTHTAPADDGAASFDHALASYRRNQ